MKSAQQYNHFCRNLQTKKYYVALMNVCDASFLTVIREIVLDEFPDESALFEALGPSYYADIRSNSLQLKARTSGEFHAADPTVINAVVAFVPVMVAAFSLVTEIVKKHKSGGDSNPTIEELCLQELRRARVAESKAVAIASKYAAKLEALAQKENVT